LLFNFIYSPRHVKAKTFGLTSLGLERAPGIRNSLVKTLRFTIMSTIYHRELSDKVIGLAFNVHRTLGYGLLESCYEGAMCVELTQAGIPFERQHVFPLVYKDEYIGAYVADLVVDDTLILELKAVLQLADIMSKQIINYLKLSGMEVGYLINFANVHLEWRRFVNTGPAAPSPRLFWPREKEEETAGCGAGTPKGN
jgi:GxxExxY protein